MFLVSQKPMVTWHRKQNFYLGISHRLQWSNFVWLLEFACPHSLQWPWNYNHSHNIYPPHTESSSTPLCAKCVNLHGVSAFIEVENTPSVSKLLLITKLIIKSGFYSDVRVHMNVVPHNTMTATWHNIHMYPYFLFAAIHHLNHTQLSLSDLVAQLAE